MIICYSGLFRDSTSRFDVVFSFKVLIYKNSRWISEGQWTLPSLPISSQPRPQRSEQTRSTGSPTSSEYISVPLLLQFSSPRSDGTTTSEIWKHFLDLVAYCHKRPKFWSLWCLKCCLCRLLTSLNRSLTMKQEQNQLCILRIWILDIFLWYRFKLT